MDKKTVWKFIISNGYFVHEYIYDTTEFQFQRSVKYPYQQKPKLKYQTSNLPKLIALCTVRNGQ